MVRIGAALLTAVFVAALSDTNFGCHGITFEFTTSVASSDDAHRNRPRPGGARLRTAIARHAVARSGRATRSSGTVTGGQLWALLNGGRLPEPKGLQVKIVWRMTGNGDLHLSATGPAGQIIRPDWGPEAHGGSNWGRPGDEWGAGFTFPVAGSWDVHAARDDIAGDVYLMVV